MSKDSRVRLRNLLRTDDDLEEFCHDYFPGVAKQFSNEMSRQQKENKLLAKADEREIKNALDQWESKNKDRYRVADLQLRVDTEKTTENILSRSPINPFLVVTGSIFLIAMCSIIYSIYLKTQVGRLMESVSRADAENARLENRNKELSKQIITEKENSSRLADKISAIENAATDARCLPSRF